MLHRFPRMDHPVRHTAGALVTDGGGPLAHAAIVAREHGLPAVVRVGDATVRLRDGQHVTVDGTSGKVTIVEEP